MNTDPIADMLTRIRNAVMARHESVSIPATKIKNEIARILKDEGFIKSYQLSSKTAAKAIDIALRYDEKENPLILGLKRVSKPGLRVYTSKDRIPSVYGGMGVAIISTSKGIMTGEDAKRQGIGGEVLCYVW